MNRKIVSAIAAISLLAAVGLFTPARANNTGDKLDISVSAKSAILIEAGTGRVLYEKDADTPRPIASTTKLMTALVVLENAGLEDTVTVTAESQGVEGTSMYLRTGDELTVRELLYGLMLESGNDAAVALAIHVAGSVESFAALMNERAASLGLENTHYVNPHGLTAEGHQSSARDLAKLMAFCMENPIFARISSTKTVKTGGRSLKNHNKLMWSYEGMLAGKTGYTKAAGRTLVTCAERDGLRLICATLNDRDDWDDHVKLYDAAFERWEMRECVSAGEIMARVPVISGVSDSAEAVAARSVKVVCEKDGEIDVRVLTPEFVYAGVKAGERAGEIEILSAGAVIDTVELEFGSDVERDDTQKLRFLERIRRSIGWKRGFKSSYLPRG